MKLSSPEARIDAGYRSLACAIILSAVRDVANPASVQEARGFLVSPDCKALARLAGIRWNVSEMDIDQAAARLHRRRSRHHRRSRQ